MNPSVATGLALLGLLSLADAAALMLTDGEHPPVEVAAIGTALVGLRLLPAAAPRRAG